MEDTVRKSNNSISGFIRKTRLRPSTWSHDESILRATQSDRGRLIYSASFRRLQQKAQVFSLESNSAVRSRLSHSIEVSHIGRTIVAQILLKLDSSTTINKDDKRYWKENSLALSNIVETACLMHDIGNPPFGHFGEKAIQQWANSSEAEETLKSALYGCSEVNCAALADFRNFDGNPQGFRIITKLQGEDGFYGLNLTCSQLASFLKYVYGNDKNKINPFSKKIGFFDTEKDVIEEVWEKLGMKSHCRHPLGFLMEASDDISYCMSDIEDGIEKGIISVGHFKEEFIREIKQVSLRYPGNSVCETLENSLNENEEAAIGAFLSFKTKLSNHLIEYVAATFVADYEAIVGLYSKSEIISKETLEYEILEILKVYTSKYLFASAEAERMELSGFSIISGILDEYQKLLRLTKNEFFMLIKNDNSNINCKGLHIESRLFNRLPEKHVNAYKAAIVGCSIPNLNKEFKASDKSRDDFLGEKIAKYDNQREWNLRTHLIVDFISGMTDQFSMEFYQMLKGINVTT